MWTQKETSNTRQSIDTIYNNMLKENEVNYITPIHSGEYHNNPNVWFSIIEVRFSANGIVTIKLPKLTKAIIFKWIERVQSWGSGEWWRHWWRQWAVVRYSNGGWVVAEWNIANTWATTHIVRIIEVAPTYMRIECSGMKNWIRGYFYCY